MIARAPGKVVLSGAYAVLEGAPALVAAVDRYVIADARRDASRVTHEVAEALARRGSGRAPWFDARALRDERDQKLGLGSSAAILVASLAALVLSDDPSLDDAALASRIFLPALDAHKAAQGGGSGIDVAASAFGGILLYERSYESGARPRITPVELPASLFIEVWSSTEAASTAGMLVRVAAFKDAHPSDYAEHIQRLAAAATAARHATSSAAFVEACREQLLGLSELGVRSGAPIVTADVRAFDRAMTDREAVVLPSGAGGGDVVLVVSCSPLGDREAGKPFGFAPLELTLGARGVHADLGALRNESRNETAP
jgi:phosphomevalonate kinase